MPRSNILFFIVAVGLLLGLLQVGVLTIAFDKLGLSQSSALLLLIASVLGSMINLPLFSVKSEPLDIETVPELWRELVRQSLHEFKGRTTIAVNVGGCLIPLVFSFYLLQHSTLSVFKVLMGVVVVAAVCRGMSRSVPGIGITLPIFAAPVAAALAALVLDQAQSAPLAYISGTLGVLIGADVLRLESIRKMGVPMASIGGAGSFDGIFITGLVAVLLA